MTPTDDRWAEVARYVADAMKRHAMSQTDLSSKSGVSAFTVRRVMRGEAGRYREDRLAKISRALGWPGNGIERILTGDTPDDFPDALPSLDEVLEEALAEAAELRREIGSLTDRVERLEQQDGPPAR